MIPTLVLGGLGSIPASSEGGGGGEQFTKFLSNMAGTNGSTTFDSLAGFAHTLTVNGGLSITTADSDFSAGAGNFNGTNASLTVSGADVGLFDFGTVSASTNLTIEFFAKFTSVSGVDYMIIGKGLPGSGGDGDGGWNIWLSGTRIQFYIGVFPGAYGVYETTTSPSAGVKTHIAVELTNGVPTIAFNGVVQSGQFVSGSTMIGTQGSQTAYGMEIGAFQIDSTHPSKNYFMSGKLAGVRITMGVSRYGGANFTAPTLPLTVDM